MKSKSKRIALYGIFAALLVVVFYLETLIGSFWITPPAIISLSLLFTLCLSEDWKLALGGGVLFGLVSWALAAMFGNAVFIFPWISVLPRLFVGIGAYGAFRLVKYFVRNKTNKFLVSYLPYSIGAMCGILINTILVIACLTIFAPDLGSLSYWISTCVTLNFPIELVAAVVLTPILCNAIKRGLPAKKKEQKSVAKTDAEQSAQLSNGETPLLLDTKNADAVLVEIEEDLPQEDAVLVGIEEELPQGKGRGTPNKPAAQKNGN